jgi:FkbM family methyltransferase
MLKKCVKYVIWLFLLLVHRSSYVPLAIRGGLAKGAVLFLDIRSQGSYWLGTYDAWILDRVDLASLIKKGDVVWDCGAFVGYYSAIFRSLVGDSGKVVTFEASSTNYRRLARISGLNQWSNVEIVQMAVGPDHCDIEFAGELGGASGPWNLGKTFAPEVTKNDVETVQCCGVDELIQERGFPAPAFLKLDLESAEIYALHNGPRLFRDKRPSMLLELHGAEAMEAAGRFLQEYQYMAAVIEQLPKTAQVTREGWISAFEKAALKNKAELSAMCATIGYVPHMLLCFPVEYRLA